MEGERPIGSTVMVDIAVIGDEISIINCERLKDFKIPLELYNNRLVINNKTSKEDIIKSIRDKIKENEKKSETFNGLEGSEKNANATRNERGDTSNGAEITKSASNKHTTNMRYTEYKPDKAYKGIKGELEDYTANDVMIYLSEIRKNNEMTAPDYLKSAHDALYTAIETRVNKSDINNRKWIELDIDMGNETKIKADKLFEIIYYIEKSKNNVKDDSYKTVKTKLDSAFDKILNNESNNVPKVYLEALKQMKSAISSFTTFKYNNGIIFDFDYMYDSSRSYTILKNLTKYLNNTIFDRFGVQTPDNEKKYPPSILLLDIAGIKSRQNTRNQTCITTTDTISRKRDDTCFDIFKSTNKNDVVRFLKYISSVDTSKPPNQ
jgi:hypothetical protein